jgi:monoamine oxidase
MGATRITRRRLVGAAATGAAGVALTRTAAADAAARTATRSADVAIVGAGLAGLTAARRLVAAGRSVVVLEARDRNNVFVGGDGRREEYPADTPVGNAPIDPVVSADIVLAVTQLDQMASIVPVDKPYIAASGDEEHPGTFERNFNTAGGAQEQRFAGGAHLVPQRVAAQLGDRIVLSSPVRTIRQDGAGVSVIADTVTVTARRAIVRCRPRWPSASPTTRSSPHSATSSCSTCRRARCSSSKRSTTARSGATTASPARR